MTTIATDGKSMAGDGQREHKGTITNMGAVKVCRLRDGSLFGRSGSVAYGDMVTEWLSKGGPTPEYKGDGGFGALHLRTDGTLWIIGEECLPTQIEAPYAVGSGMDLAIGAMRAGASPQRAVEIAIACDPGTGGTITEVSLSKVASIRPAPSSPGRKRA